MAWDDTYGSTFLNLSLHVKSCPPALDRSGHPGIRLKVAQVETSESIHDKRYTIEVNQSINQIYLKSILKIQ